MSEAKSELHLLDEAYIKELEEKILSVKPAIEAADRIKELEAKLADRITELRDINTDLGDLHDDMHEWGGQMWTDGLFKINERLTALLEQEQSDE